MTPADLEDAQRPPARPAGAAGTAAAKENQRACEHEWGERGGPGDEWLECWLCGEQVDQ